ncbi:hypothetical protein [Aliarcobacter cryaerophilus]|uniref:hypothetical protein n=1 Tax=Aliarcobacter cryaerophilus TaxID=28198 RepID=UPI0021B39531|nr:hypothetical protein [Aliarcobacter cryaerophilus]MCT7511906.1 hypothetical protein [Aliarcobacter cryaerophilus]MCT7542718.1 hypothetical protein [Aliarcobacter cryaerophilus]
MADSHVISALSTKRGEILGSIKHCKQIISSLDQDLANIDATIKIFEPDYKFGSEKVVNKHRNRFFNNGEAKVLALEVLKNSNLALSTDKISDNIAVNKNLSFENKADKANFQKSILLALNTCLSNNIVEKVSKKAINLNYHNLSFAFL